MLKLLPTVEERFPRDRGRYQGPGGWVVLSARQEASASWLIELLPDAHKLRPIVFSTRSVPLIDVGEKTTTRRIIRRQPDGKLRGCPWGRVGDHLYIKETFGALFLAGDAVVPWAKASQDGRNVRQCVEARYAAIGDSPPEGANWVSPRFMPRWAKRRILELTRIGRERISEIDDAGAALEGFSSREAFLERWAQIHPNPEDEDPWVDVLTFRRLI